MGRRAGARTRGLAGEGRFWETRLLPREVRQERRSLAGGRDEGGKRGGGGRGGRGGAVFPEGNLVVIGWNSPGARDRQLRRGYMETGEI